MGGSTHALKSSLFLSPSTPRIRIRSDRGHTTRACLTHETHTRTPQMARTWKKECTSHAPPGDLEGQARCAHSRHTHTHTHTHKTRHTSVVYSAAPLPVLVRRAVGTPHQRACAHTLSMRTCHTHSRHTSHMTSLTALPRTAYRTRVCFLSALISSYQLLLPSCSSPLQQRFRCVGDCSQVPSIGSRLAAPTITQAAPAP